MKLILVLIATLTLNLLGHTQTSSRDSISESDLRKVLKAAEDGKIYKAQLDILQNTISILQGRITDKETIIAELRKSDTANLHIIDTYKAEIESWKRQVADAEKTMNDYKKALRKEKRKRFWTAMGGLALAAGVGILVH